MRNIDISVLLKRGFQYSDKRRIDQLIRSKTSSGSQRGEAWHRLPFCDEVAASDERIRSGGDVTMLVMLLNKPHNDGHPLRVISEKRGHPLADKSVDEASTLQCP